MLKKFSLIKVKFKNKDNNDGDVQKTRLEDSLKNDLAYDDYKVISNEVVDEFKSKLSLYDKNLIIQKIAEYIADIKSWDEILTDLKTHIENKIICGDKNSTLYILNWLSDAFEENDKDPDKWSKWIKQNLDESLVNRFYKKLCIIRLSKGFNK
jgi:hypothetical protein